MTNLEVDWDGFFRAHGNGDIIISSDIHNTFRSLIFADKKIHKWEVLGYTLFWWDGVVIATNTLIRKLLKNGVSDDVLFINRKLKF